MRGKRPYHVEWKHVNTADFGKIPQDRPRIYVVGAWRSMLGKGEGYEFPWPVEVKPPKLMEFLKPNTAPEWSPKSRTGARNSSRLWSAARKRDNENPGEIMHCFDVTSSEQFGPNFMKQRSPTLTRSRAGSSGFYLSAWKRTMTTTCICRFQCRPTSMRSLRAFSAWFLPLLAT